MKSHFKCNENIKIGITNAHSMGKLFSHFLTNHKDICDKMILHPTTKVDGIFGLKTTFTQGGLCTQTFYDIEWYLWMGIGGSFYAFSPKYECVFSYLPMGHNRVDIGMKKLIEGIGRGPRESILFKYISEYLKTL